MPPPEHPNAIVARRMWDAVARGDIDDLTALYTSDVVLRIVGDGPFAGEYKGVPAVLRCLSEPAERADDMRSNLLDIYAGDDGAVLRYTVHAERGEDHVEHQLLLRMRVANGRIFEAEVVNTDGASDPFWETT
jgi:ketosteroid isomerase-like protein